MFKMYKNNSLNKESGRPTSESSSKELNLSWNLKQTWPELDNKSPSILHLPLQVYLQVYLPSKSHSKSNSKFSLNTPPRNPMF